MSEYLEKLKTLGNPSLDLSEVTIGVTVFDRPAHLQRFVDSVRKYYPTLRIVVADNGLHPSVPVGDLITYCRLLPDCGLSASRNRLLEACSTNYLLICEEDFVFTDETSIASLLSVLRYDDDVALVAGPLITNGVRVEFCKSFDWFRGRLTTIDNASKFRITPEFVPYRYADMVFNFFLCRREAFNDIRWDESLKLAEHLDHMFRIFQERKWRIAHTPNCIAIHDLSDRSQHYVEHRIRARDWVRKWQATKTYRDVSQYTNWYGKPNVIIYGVGHSGTSYVSKCFKSLGWDLLDADEEYHESLIIRRINNTYYREGNFNTANAAAALRGKHGWCIKDPRFVETLPLWLPIFQQLKTEPILLWLKKDINDVRQSYERRSELVAGKAGVRDLSVEDLYEMAERNYKLWPFSKISINYEDIVKCFNDFKPKIQSTPLNERE